MDDCRALCGDQVDAELSWRGGTPAELKGQTVRLHVQMYKADLYAMRF